MKHVVLVIVFFILLKIYTLPAISASLNSTSLQGDITFEQEFVVNSTLSIQAADGTNYFLRGVFYKEGSSNYCGITWNGSEWFSGPYSTNEGWKKFLKVTMANNTWQGELKARIDKEDSGCSQSGMYKFKIQRFNEGSGSSNFDDQNELSVNIMIPTPTNTPTPTSKPTPTLKPTSTPKPTLTPKTVSSVNSNVDNTEVSEVLGLVTEQSLDEEDEMEFESDPNTQLKLATRSGSENEPGITITENPNQFDLEKKKNPYVTIGGFFSLLASCGILVMRKIRG